MAMVMLELEHFSISGDVSEEEKTIFEAVFNGVPGQTIQTAFSDRPYQCNIPIKPWEGRHREQSYHCKSMMLHMITAMVSEFSDFRLDISRCLRISTILQNSRKLAGHFSALQMFQVDKYAMSLVSIEKTLTTGS